MARWRSGLVVEGAGATPAFILDSPVPEVVYSESKGYDLNLHRTCPHYHKSQTGDDDTI
jgi:hypothetical protein